ncbi:MAG: hypothetical protein UX73_C0028G0003 [candidate division WWE3 bacterium GW2011_GWC1_47_10]|uniref:DUF1232 domain-containing protein n=1 Tax=candidate division WWE3 bacterium GW2011_GWC1_47_10 TaxID=1619122 RepID=A0A0G1QXP7_UNCKA|nr:MAG: hypothetical protein UX73_C0028G0003 [candidate division WWE3 bacterium GW2011_GWC1_47_10]
MKLFLKNNWMLVAAILYALLPFDIIPDVLLPVGFADDLGVLIVTLLLRYLKHRKGTILHTDVKEDILDGEVVED